MAFIYRHVKKIAKLGLVFNHREKQQHLVFAYMRSRFFARLNFFSLVWSVCGLKQFTRPTTFPRGKCMYLVIYQGGWVPDDPINMEIDKDFVPRKI